MKFTSLTYPLSIIASLATGVSSVVVPGADTPSFYFVASSSSSASNLLPLRLDGTLTGTTPIVQFYFFQGRLTVLDPTSGSTYRPLVNSGFIANDCSTDGSLAFVQGSSSNKCAQTTGFQIQSDTENSQLGADLVFNYVGGFYACGTNQAVWYKVAAGDSPTGCSPISLYTVPVVA